MTAGLPDEYPIAKRSVLLPDRDLSSLQSDNLHYVTADLYCDDKLYSQYGIALDCTLGMDASSIGLLRYT